MANESSRPRARPDAPETRDAPTYSEEQVAQILRRTVQLERRRARAGAGLSLAEVEAIARDSGLDASLVREAARSLAQVETEQGPWTRIAGAPLRRTIERVIDGEIDARHHEALLADLRAALPVSGGRQPAQVASVGRTLMMNGRFNSGTIEIRLTPRDGKTVLTIAIDSSGLAGGLFGGLAGGLGGGLMPLTAAIAVNNHAPAAIAALAVVGTLGAAFTLARTIFGFSARGLYRRMETFADALEGRVREELARG